MARDGEVFVSLLGRSSKRKGSDEEGYMDSKWEKTRWKMSPGPPNMRAKKMAQGAASIMNRWPDHILFCWLTALAFGVIILLCIFIFQKVTIPIEEPLPCTPDTLTSECLIRRDKRETNIEFSSLKKVPIHLHVILNDGEVFKPERYKSQLTSALLHNPLYSLNIYVLLNDTDTQEYDRNSRFKDWEIYHRGVQKHKFFLADFEAIEEDEDDEEDNGDKSKEDILFDNKDIKIIHSSFSNYFQYSPLRDVWKTYPKDLFPLIFKVLTLWEYGGISLPFKMFIDKTEEYTSENHQYDLYMDILDQLRKESAFYNTPAQNEVTEFQKQLIEGLLGPTVEKTEIVVVQNDSIVQNQEKPALQNETVLQNIQNEPPKIITDANMQPVNQTVTRPTKKPGTKAPKSYPADEFKIMGQELPDPAIPAQEIEKQNLQKLLKDRSREVPDVLSSPEVISENSQNEMKIGTNDGLPNFASEKDNEVSSRKRRSLQEAPILANIAEDKKTDDGKVTELQVIEPNTNSDGFLSMVNGDGNAGFVIIISDENSDDLSLVRNPFGDLKLDDTFNMIKDFFDTIPLLQMPFLINEEALTPEENDWEFRESWEEMSGKKMITNHFRESRAFREYSSFGDFNIFTQPLKNLAHLDRYGYYLAVRRPCHAFLGEVISSLIKRGQYYTNFEEIIPDNLRRFCQGKKITECPGIAII